MFISDLRREPGFIDIVADRIWRSWWQPKGYPLAYIHGRLEENLGAVDLELTNDDLAEIDAGASKIEVQGERLPEAVLKMTGH